MIGVVGSYSLTMMSDSMRTHLGGTHGSSSSIALGAECVGRAGDSDHRPSDGVFLDGLGDVRTVMAQGSGARYLLSSGVTGDTSKGA